MLSSRYTIVIANRRTGVVRRFTIGLRTLIAVVENGQEADGSVTLPPALAPWLGGRGRITAAGDLA